MITLRRSMQNKSSPLLCCILYSILFYSILFYSKERNYYFEETYQYFSTKTTGTVL
jgi:hypothetical protein